MKLTEAHCRSMRFFFIRSIVQKPYNLTTLATFAGNCYKNR